MTAALGLGTYRCNGIPEAARYAAISGVRWIDTAPNYADGRAQSLLKAALADHPDVQVSTKIGFLTRADAAQALADRVLTQGQAARRHGVGPELVHWQTARNREQLGRPRIDLQLLHNPDHGAESRDELHQSLRAAFTALEQEVADGAMTGYGVATWCGFSGEAFTVAELLNLAAEAAGTTEHHLSAIQLPVSLVMIEPMIGATAGHGPVAEAAEAGLHVMASAPLYGGELADLVGPELAHLIAPGQSQAQSALLAVASVPGITTVLLSASSAPHWDEAQSALAGPSLTAAQLRDVTDALSTT